MGSVSHRFGCPCSAVGGVDVQLAGAEGGWCAVFRGPDDAAPSLRVLSPPAPLQQNSRTTPTPTRLSFPAVSLTAALMHCVSSKSVFSRTVMDHLSEARQPRPLLCVLPYALPPSPHVKKVCVITAVISIYIYISIYPQPPCVRAFVTLSRSFVHPLLPLASLFLPVLAGAAVYLRVAPAAWKGRRGGVLAPLPDGGSSSRKKWCFPFCWSLEVIRSPTLTAFPGLTCFIGLGGLYLSSGPALQTSTN